MTLEEWADAYVRTVLGPEDGLGQCVHPELGTSTDMLRVMWRDFGVVASNEAVDRRFEASRPDCT